MPRAAPSLAALGIVFAGALASAAAWAPAQAPPETASVSGVVTDETGGVMQAVAVRVFPEGGAQPVRETATLALEESVDVVDTAEEFRVDALSSLTPTTLSGDGPLGLPADEEEEEEDLAPRIEIITRPGTGRWRRSVDLDFSDESLDARTPGERMKPARQTRDLDVDLRGPVVPGRVELDVEASTNTRQRAANSLRGITPAGNVFDGVVRPEREHQHELDLDAAIEIASNRSMGVRFDYKSSHAENSGVGGFTLAEQGTNDAHLPTGRARPTGEWRSPLRHQRARCRPAYRVRPVGTRPARQWLRRSARVHPALSSLTPLWR